jgi:hypothetical protein
MTDRDQAAIDIIKRLLAAQNELDQVGRPDGDHLTITRQQLDAVVDDIRAAARLTCDLADAP